MKVTGLGWMGTKTRQFDRMNTFYRDVLNLDVVSIDDKSGRFKLDDGTEVHVYGSKDEDHEFFGNGPVVAFEVDDFAAARTRLLGFGIGFIYQEPQRASGRIWQHFRAPDGNVYEIIGNDVAGGNIHDNASNI
jgi:catechol 2,3-dioxygenase-like lactoylglutathione lyase family enzyme